MIDASQFGHAINADRSIALPDTIAAMPRLRLANLPTPVWALPRLSRALDGPTLLMKRDDLTGLATGGNKTRKLEFLVADALGLKADCLITAGGLQSNHCRQTAAAAALAGLDCHLVLGGSQPSVAFGNLLLDRLLGAHIHWTEKQRRNERMAELAEELKAQGRRPYVIPIGGSNAVGALGYVVAMYELVDQLAQAGRQVDRIYFATSSGGTQAGLLLGARMAGFAGEVTAISIDQSPADNFGEEVANIANATAELIGTRQRIEPHDVQLVYDYLGEGYGVLGDLERESIQMVAQTEGILVGPVYTGRALGGVIDLVRRGEITRDETILFWHTGDESALHGYADELM